jgi:hypothetical protein
MIMKAYKLDGKNIVQCSFDESLSTNTCMANRQIARDTFGEVEISTVFLIFDHSYDSDKPVLFETMIFGGEHDGYQDRYHAYDEALIGHQVACDLVNRIPIERDNKLNELGI